MTYKKNFLAIITLIAIVLLCIAVFNYKTDPEHIFMNRGKAEKKIADLLLRKKNVANADKYDERLIHKYAIDGNSKKKDVLIFGSSRVMLINNYLVPKQTFFNHGVPAGTIEDYMAIHQIYKEKNLLPKKIIIGIDPWALNANNEIERWESLGEEYIRACNNLKINKNAYDEKILYKKYLKLVSMPYLHASYVSIKKPNKIKYYATKATKLPVYIKIFDGTTSYPEKTINPPHDEIKKMAIEYAEKNPIFYLGNFKNLDGNKIEKYDKLISELQKEKIEVIIFLLPYHPIAYNAIKNNRKYAMVLQAENYFIKFAKEHQIKIIGSYDPDKCNLSEDGFYDGEHAKTESVDKILRGQL